ncbi:hypothetical protein ACN47E_009448 [Coniothyrium glycines]
MTGTEPYAIGALSSVEEVQAHWWPLLQELGWNRDKSDAEGHFLACQNGKTWLHIIPDSSTRPEGSVMACIYPNRTGWVGCFIMNAAFRGKGLGRELWKEMDITFRRYAITKIGLDGVPEQVNTYKRRGFESVGEIPCMTRSSLDCKPATTPVNLEEGVELQDLRDIDSKELAKLDLEHTGLDRTAYWVDASQTTRRGCFGFGIVKEGKLTGFIFVRNVENGSRFGPLYAETYAEAKQLLHKAMNDARRSAGYHTEVFGNNPEARRVFEDLGWEYAGLTFDRMWLHGRVPEEQLETGKGGKGMYAIFDAACG